MAEQLIKYQSWRIWTDVDQNLEIYAKISTGSPEQCACSNCLAFVGMRESFYPATLKTFLTSIGIDHRKEAEIVWYGDQGKPPERLEGWYNFVGRIESGEEDLHAFDEHFQLEISSRGILVPKEFEGLQVIRLEWVWMETASSNPYTD